MVQISATTSEIVTQPEVYKDFEDVFSTKNACHLPLYEDLDHTIDLIDDKQLSYKLIYNFSQNKLSIFRTYIDQNLANRFIRLSKSPAGALIFIVPQHNGVFQLYVDYQGLNNLTIKNRVPLPLVRNSLDRLCCAKMYTS